MLSTPHKIGHGAVGCVYRPAIPCKNGTVPKGYVSKLIKKESLPFEYNEELIAKLKEIDPDENYVIRPVKADELCATNAEANAKTIESCTPFQEQVFQGKAPVKKNNTAVLYQQDAGPRTLASLIEAEYTRQYNPSEEVMDALSKTIEIEDFLLENGLTHADISFGNIMVLDDGSVRFIDIAGIQTTDTVKEAKANFLEALRNSQISTYIGPLKRLIKPFQFGLPIATPSNSNSQETLLLDNVYGNENNENNENSVPMLRLPNGANGGGKHRGKRRNTRGLKGQTKRKRATKKVRRTK